MGNPHKGEVELKAGDSTYTLRYSIDAICRLEAQIGKPFGKIAMDMTDDNTASVTLARALLHAALFDRHPEITVEKAGELISECGGVVAVMNKVSEAIVLAFPPQEASGTARPLKVLRKAGQTS